MRRLAAAAGVALLHEIGLLHHLANNSFFYSEEPLAELPHKKCISVSDRGTLSNLLAHHDGYTIFVTGALVFLGQFQERLHDERVVLGGDGELLRRPP